MGNHRDLDVWQRSHRLATRMDFEAKRFAKGNGPLADQLRRALMSVPSNLAEGASRGRDGEFARFINIAIGSAAEADSLLLHAANVRALSATVCSEMIAELTIVRKMLYKLRRAITPGKGASTNGHRPKPVDRGP